MSDGRYQFDKTVGTKTAYYSPKLVFSSLGLYHAKFC